MTGQTQVNIRGCMQFGGFNKNFIHIVESMRPNGPKEYHQCMAPAEERFQAAFDVVQHFHEDHFGSPENSPARCSCTKGNQQEKKWIWPLRGTWSLVPAADLHTKDVTKAGLGLQKVPATQLLFLKAQDDSFKSLLEVQAVCTCCHNEQAHIWYVGARRLAPR